MQFDFLDRYLLDGAASKASVVQEVLQRRSAVPACSAFYEGIEMLGPGTPDLTLIALRLVLAGKAADDERVARLRSIVQRARANDAGRQHAVREYYEEIA